jgi:hypothetical protein
MFAALAPGVSVSSQLAHEALMDRRVVLDAAAFQGSSQAAALQAPAALVRTTVQNFLAACYTDLGKAPRLLDGDDLRQVLLELLPRHFGVRDPLAATAEPVLRGYLEFLNETQVVPAMYELRMALDAHAEGFRAAVESGSAHRGGIADTGTVDTVRHRADKTGRNDPCPCGSGRKFKKCCGAAGGR